MEGDVMSDRVDVVVAGLGIHGSSAVASLARRGRRVIGLERFPDGHARGSSHGRTRMIRRAYPNPVWNGLVDNAYEAWTALERETGRKLVYRTGGMYAHAGASQLQGPDWLDGGSFGAEASVLTVLTCGIVSLLMLRRILRTRSAIAPFWKREQRTDARIAALR